MMYQKQVDGGEILVKRCISLNNCDLESYICVIMTNVKRKINNLIHLLNIFIVALSFCIITLIITPTNALT